MDSLSIAQREHDTHATAYCLDAMACLAVVEDDSGQALRLYGRPTPYRVISGSRNPFLTIAG